MIWRAVPHGDLSKRMNTFQTRSTSEFSVVGGWEIEGVSLSHHRNVAGVCPAKGQIFRLATYLCYWVCFIWGGSLCLTVAIPGDNWCQFWLHLGSRVWLQGIKSLSQVQCAPSVGIFHSCVMQRFPLPVRRLENISHSLMSPTRRGLGICRDHGSSSLIVCPSLKYWNLSLHLN